MSPTLMRLLATALVMVATVLAVIGWRVSQRPPPVMQAPMAAQPAPAAPSAHAVLVAGRDLARGERLDPAAEPAALRVAYYPAPVAGSYAMPAELAGQRLTRPVAVGEVLRPAHFAAGGALARAVPAGKRAVAVAVNEVIGGGGFLEPGDRVDVLFQARASAGDKPQLARRLFDNVQVLAYGAETQDGEGGDGAAGAGDKTARAAASDSGRRGGRTAVLAMDEAQAASLLLAETSGQLRLALIGAEEHRALLEREARALEAEGVARAGASAPASDAVRPAANVAGAARPANEARINGGAQAATAGFGPVVVFDELAQLPAARAGTRAARGRVPAATAAPRRIVQYVGGEVRVVELP